MHALSDSFSRLNWSIASLFIVLLEDHYSTDIEVLRWYSIAVADAPGRDAARYLHSHFTDVYFENGDEKHHCVLGEGLGPDFSIFARVVAERRYCSTIVSESPILDIDSLRMREMYQKSF